MLLLLLLATAAAAPAYATDPQPRLSLPHRLAANDQKSLCLLPPILPRNTLLPLLPFFLPTLVITLILSKKKPLSLSPAPTNQPLTPLQDSLSVATHARESRCKAYSFSNRSRQKGSTRFPTAVGQIRKDNAVINSLAADFRRSKSQQFPLLFQKTKKN